MMGLEYNRPYRALGRCFRSSRRIEPRICEVMLLLMFVVVWSRSNVDAFMMQRPVWLAGFSSSLMSSSLILGVKKKKGKSSSGKGFGKEAAPVTTASRSSSSSSYRPKPSPSGPGGLTSIEAASSINTPVTTPAALANVDRGVADEEMAGLSAEERTQMILKSNYGMKTLAEQQADVKRREVMKEQERKLNAWKKQLDDAKKDEDWDIMTVVPAPILVGVDRFLKAGVVISAAAFIAAGIAITLEAYGKATGNSVLPPDAQQFITETIEPNFTIGLGVVLFFSISLGLFASAQLGSKGAQYRE